MGESMSRSQKALRHHADDGMGAIVDPHDLSDASGRWSKSRCHTRWLRIARDAASLAAASPAANVRPTSGATPSIAKSSGVTALEAHAFRPIRDPGVPLAQ